VATIAFGLKGDMLYNDIERMSKFVDVNILNSPFWQNVKE